MRVPSRPSTTRARTSSRDWMPYDGTRCTDRMLGSTSCSPTTALVLGLVGSMRSVAYWPADAPTCHVASTTATPAFTAGPFGALMVDAIDASAAPDGGWVAVGGWP